MYIPDGEAKDAYVEDENYYAWGWLGDTVPKENYWDKGEKEKFLKRLEKMKHKVDCTRGFHICEICGEAMGNASVKISYDGKIFCCPSGVAHYIEDHGYCPPQKVIAAVFSGVFLKEEDLSPDWNLGKEEFKKERDEKLKKALEKGMKENRRF